MQGFPGRCRGGQCQNENKNQSQIAGQSRRCYPPVPKYFSISLYKGRGFQVVCVHSLPFYIKRDWRGSIPGAFLRLPVRLPGCYVPVLATSFPPAAICGPGSQYRENGILPGGQFETAPLRLGSRYSSAGWTTDWLLPTQFRRRLISRKAPRRFRSSLFPLTFA